MRKASVLAAGAVVLFGAAVSQAVVIGQTDDFQDDTAQGWGVGGIYPDPNLVHVVADSGPAGSGDFAPMAYSMGDSGLDATLTVFNTDQWAGDYLSAGVTAISCHLKNVTPEALSIRVQVEGPGGGFFSVVPVTLPGNSGWVLVEFPLELADLTGGADYNATMGNVQTLRIFHNPDASWPPPEAGMAAIWFDNVIAVPEPASLALLALGGLALLRRRR